MKFSDIAKDYSAGVRFSSEKLHWVDALFLSAGLMKPTLTPPKADPLFLDKDKIFHEDLFAVGRVPVNMKLVDLLLPSEEVHVLRMPLCFSGLWAVSKDFTWLVPFLAEAAAYQQEHFDVAKYPHAYLTIRHGEQREKATDVWHSDGFQGKLDDRHVGDINYIWTSDGATEWVTHGFDIPKDFDPAIHNFFSVLQQLPIYDTVMSLPRMMQCFDGYSVHRKNAPPGKRTFIRLTYTAFEITDPNYTPSPFFDLKYDRGEPRDKLVDYQFKKEG